jgi:PhnB protein
MPKPKKIDPLNSKQYSAVTTMLTVADVKAAMTFYQKAFGFTKRSVMNGPDRKPMHAEITLRNTTIMLGPENPERGARSAKSLGGSAGTLFLTAENVDKVVAKAVKLGATPAGPVMDMFWGDRCGTIIDPDGYSWMVATHVADVTEQEMKKSMAQMSASTSTQTASAAGGAASN